MMQDGWVVLCALQPNSILSSDNKEVPNFFEQDII